MLPVEALLATLLRVVILLEPNYLAPSAGAATPSRRLTHGLPAIHGMGSIMPYPLRLRNYVGG
ncbi:MAG: hypothetical protein ACFB14_21285 [Leptolyngbyaceae cyanobacterium]